jgi:hypothetical protein
MRDALESHGHRVPLRLGLVTVDMSRHDILYLGAHLVNPYGYAAHLGHQVLLTLASSKEK